jgi:hypothetical protein
MARSLLFPLRGRKPTTVEAGKGSGGPGKAGRVLAGGGTLGEEGLGAVVEAEVGPVVVVVVEPLELALEGAEEEEGEGKIEPVVVEVVELTAEGAEVVVVVVVARPFFFFFFVAGNGVGEGTRRGSRLGVGDGTILPPGGGNGGGCNGPPHPPKRRWEAVKSKGVRGEPQWWGDITGAVPVKGGAAGP